MPFEGCSHTSDGGAVHMDMHSQSIKLAECSFTSCSAGVSSQTNPRGGALCLDCSGAVISHCSGLELGSNIGEFMFLDPYSGESCPLFLTHSLFSVALPRAGATMALALSMDWSVLQPLM
jgi:hypothetical protein